MTPAPLIALAVLCTLVAALRNLYRYAELREITFEEACARSLIWPVCVAVSLGKGLVRTVKGGFK